MNKFKYFFLSNVCYLIVFSLIQYNVALAQGGDYQGRIELEYWEEISGSEISALTGNAHYPDSPTGRSYPTVFESLADWNDNFGTRFRGYVHPPTDGQYTLLSCGHPSPNGGRIINPYHSIAFLLRGTRSKAESREIQVASQRRKGAHKKMYRRNRKTCLS